MRAVAVAWRLVAKGGVLLVASRTRQEVSTEARKLGWEKYADGYVTGAGTFQKGHSARDLIELCGRTGLVEWNILEDGNYTGILLAKRRWL
jgi:phosphoglycolate phosphatase-like HAD superfamily hydrolase